ncbi:MAG: cyclopropane-fatty-acyl-phospholipid synthase family protein [Alphaproteobacteria bacterium]|nr:cyclopropane-fatty-acyl-phospholipid synthase family protein [Alphaproteobacteria bacterium]
MLIRMNPGNLNLMKGLPTSMRLAGMLLVRLKKGCLDIVFRDGRTYRFEGGEPGPSGEIIVHDPSFAGRVLSRGDIGFAEAFMAGKFDTPDLAAVLEYFTQNFESAGKLAVGDRLTHFISAVRHAFRANTKKGSRRNILAHYDLGNDFYARWLDPSMTYSSAIFREPSQSLEDAQQDKYRAIATRLDLKPGMKVLEIGSGWGGFAEVAARDFGAEVTSITISDAQHDYARDRMARNGLSDRVSIKMCDYRDVTGAFDAVASIEMFEAVGEKFWPQYFGKVAEALKPGGKAALQIITIDEQEFENYRARPDFIQRYIFPGGMLPSIERIAKESARAGLGCEVAQLFGQSYARTLADWQTRFEREWDAIRTQGFDERFRRLWLYYLGYCQAGFRSGRIDVGHFVLTRPA